MFTLAMDSPEILQCEKLYQYHISPPDISRWEFHGARNFFGNLPISGFQCFPRAFHTNIMRESHHRIALRGLAWAEHLVPTCRVPVSERVFRLLGSPVEQGIFLRPP
jgi:hypothetical protein